MVKHLYLKCGSIKFIKAKKTKNVVLTQICDADLNCGDVYGSTKNCCGSDGISITIWENFDLWRSCSKSANYSN